MAVAPATGRPHHQPVTRGDFHLYADRDVERLDSLEAAANLPVLVVSKYQAAEVRAAGWRPLAAGWQWRAFSAPEGHQPGDSSSAPDSRRLE